MTVYSLPAMTASALPGRPLSVALGNFDGVHLGHRRLLRAAARPDCARAVWTFSSLAKCAPHVPVLTPQEEKLRQIARSGIEYAVMEEFETVLELTPAQFVEEILLGQLHAAAVACGFNFRFGRGAAGTAETLGALLAPHGVPLTVVPPFCLGGEAVSSTRIRAAVADGRMEEAAALLGRPFSLTAPVRHGKALGRKLGLATINQNFPEGQAVPRRGVYAGYAYVNGRRCAAVSDVGVRPSVETAGEVRCETHILDFDGALYGETVRVEFCRYLRGEMRFASPDALRKAIEEDIRRARAALAAEGGKRP